MKRKKEILLREYEKAQDSAEHYNTMIWILIPIMFGFCLYMIKFSLFEKGILLLFRAIAIIFGAAGLFFFSYLIESANEKKQLSYETCKRIESISEINLVKRHQATEKLGISSKTFYFSKKNRKQYNPGMFLFRLSKKILYFTYLILLIGLLLGQEQTSNLDLLAKIITIILALYLTFKALVVESFYEKNQNNWDVLLRI